MNAQESTRVVGFLAKARPDSEQMKAHIINSLNALLQSNDPVAARFSQILTEAMNRSASMVLNESSNVPNLPPQALQSPFGMQTPQYQQPQQTPAMLAESVTDHAARLLL